MKKKITTDKGLLSPSKLDKSSGVKKQIKVGKNDIVEREENISTDDGRQLLK